MSQPTSINFGVGVALRPSGSLVDRALAYLTQGPTSTARLAAEVLALKGNPNAAASAVFALLGSDPRVHVDGSGVWSMVSSEDVVAGVPFRDEEWVVVDVETTGGSPARGHRVIEIAAVRVAAGRIVGEYSTLVNPRRAIPRMITSLTGIANEAVGNAPYFEQVVPAVTASLGGRVFVGHNAMFDWRFVCAEMERCTGRTLTGRQFCTLRVARRLLPNLPSRSLCALADYFGVEMTTHHRALDDAVATARLLLRFLEILSEHGVHDWHALDAFYRKSRRKKRRKAWPVPMDMA